MIAAPITTKYADALNEKFPNRNFATTGGRKYDRVVVDIVGQRSVHCFVERATGLVYKAAGWAAPAKDARHDISTETGFTATVEQADWAGGYLYKR